MNANRCDTPCLMHIKCSTKPRIYGIILSSYRFILSPYIIILSTYIIILSMWNYTLAIQNYTINIYNYTLKIENYRLLLVKEFLASVYLICRHFLALCGHNSPFFSSMISTMSQHSASYATWRQSTVYHSITPDVSSLSWVSRRVY